MSDLLRVLRVARTLGGMVGLRHYGWFRVLCYALAFSGLFTLAGGGAVGLVVAVGGAVAVSRFRAAFRGGRGAHSG